MGEINRQFFARERKYKERILMRMGAPGSGQRKWTCVNVWTL